MLSSDDPVRRCRCAYFERHLSKEYRILIRPLPSVKLMRTLINPLPKSSFKTTVRWRPVQQGNGLVPALFAFPASLNLHTACRTDPWALSERARSALKKVASLPRRQHLPSNWNNASWLPLQEPEAALLYLRLFSLTLAHAPNRLDDADAQVYTSALAGSLHYRFHLPQLSVF